MAEQCQYAYVLGGVNPCEQWRRQTELVPVVRGLSPIADSYQAPGGSLSGPPWVCPLGGPQFSPASSLMARLQLPRLALPFIVRNEARRW